LGNFLLNLAGRIITMLITSKLRSNERDKEYERQVADYELREFRKQVVEDTRARFETYADEIETLVDLREGEAFIYSLKGLDYFGELFRTFDLADVRQREEEHLE